MDMDDEMLPDQVTNPKLELGAGQKSKVAKLLSHFDKNQQYDLKNKKGVIVWRLKEDKARKRFELYCLEDGPAYLSALFPYEYCKREHALEKALDYNMLPGKGEKKTYKTIAAARKADPLPEEG